MASMKIRESFKCAYLQNYERNLRRMNSEKQRLLWREGGGGGDANTEAAEGEAGQGRGPPSAIALWGRDLLEVLSCFYCCYAFEALPVQGLSKQQGRHSAHHRGIARMRERQHLVDVCCLPRDRTD
ncbi:hypothetical protein EUGRSUZ_L01019 [Eucalyptus grandis]|uniref:Uncharacterized protein n=1 Tax=Eucalyptus grandis TaxID=71139 RepID=A0A058ZW97_EUCGR|nr:hypothetical protein EUGRSUZ_L01019 [Eucalyptus grandis]